MANLRACLWFRVACLRCHQVMDVALESGEPERCPDCDSLKIYWLRPARGQTTRSLPYHSTPRPLVGDYRDELAPQGEEDGDVYRRVQSSRGLTATKAGNGRQFTHAYMKS